MSIHDNQALDDAVLAAVKNGSGTFTEIRTALAKAGVEADYRAVDRSVQRLRRRDAIRFAGTPRRWRA